MTREQVVADIRDAVVAIIGEEWADQVDISADRKLSNGLDLDSIEIAKVIETMMAKHPDVDFAGWFTGMDIERITSLTVGDFADFIVRSKVGVLQ